MNTAALTRVLTAKGLSPQDIEEAVQAAKSRELKIRFVPDFWHPTESHYAKALELGISDDAFTVLLASFREWEFRDGKSNFDLAFHRWLRTGAQRTHGTAIAHNFPADRADARIGAMVAGARQALTSGRRRWGI